MATVDAEEVAEIQAHSRLDAEFIEEPAFGIASRTTLVWIPTRTVTAERPSCGSPSPAG